MAADTLETDARHAPDRRRRPTPALSRYWLRGRRRGGRRAGETVDVYVDRYSPTELGLALALLALSAVDLLLTLRHVAAGGQEANPLMAWTLAGGGTLGFALAKAGLTMGATLVLLLHVRFRLARRSLPALVGLYLCVMVWHGVVALDRLAV